MKENSLLFQNFSGELIRVITNQFCHVCPEHEKQHYLEYEGTLLDLDDEFLYLGEDTSGVNSAIPKNAILYIFIVDPTLEQTDNVFPFPHGNKDSN